MRCALLVSVVAACGSPTHPAADAPPPIDGHHVDAPVDAHAIDAPPDAVAGLGGLVSLTEDNTTSGAPATSSAMFVMGSPFGTALGTSGACTLYENPPQAGLSAGTITVTGANVTFSLVPSGTAPNVRYQASMPLPNDLFATGATLHVSAPGADFPAFSLDVTGTAPLAGYTPPTMISRSAGYTATWTTGSGTGVLIEIAAFSGSTIDVIVCQVPDNGSFAVTPAILALIPAAMTSVFVGVAATDEMTATGTGNSTLALYAVDVVTTDSIPLAP